VPIGVSEERIAFIFRFKQFVHLLLLDSEDGSNRNCGWLNECTTDPALQSVGMSFLSGNLSVLSGSRGTLYTTQHSRYYELYYFTSYISLFSLTLQNYWIYIWMHL